MVHARVGTLRPVNPSRQLRRPQRHAPTTPLPLPKCRAEFMQVIALHPLPNSTGPYLAVLPHPPSCSTNPHGRHLLPILTTATYLRAILFFTFQPRLIFLRHSHLCITATLTPTSRTSAPSCFSLSTASLLLYHCQNVGLPVTSATPNSTFAILFYQSSRRHRRHLPTLRHGLALLRPSFSTTYPYGGTAPSCFSNHVTASSGTPS